jgi:glycosyltransferase involved in cell wall biosynthesis
MTGADRTPHWPRIRVLELIKCLDVGGAETLLLERMRLADHERFAYTVGWLDPNRRHMLPELRAAGVAVHCFGARSGLDWRWLVPLRRYLRAHQIDVVHVHSPAMAAGVRLVALSLGAARPALLTTEHSVRYHPLTQLLDLATVRVDDLVVAVSGAVLHAPVSRRARRAVTVEHGVNVARIQEYRAARARLATELGLLPGPRVVTVANLRPEKGHATLLSAARLVHRWEPTAHFYVVGQGPLGDWVNAEIRRHRMTGYFHLMGLVPDAARLAACADLFVLSSTWEGRPVALMEALAAGVPAVVTAVGGMPEMVQDGRNGRLVPADDPVALADAIRAVLSDRSLRDRLSVAASASAEQYDLVTAVRVLETYYTDLADRAGARRLAGSGPGAAGTRIPSRTREDG